MDDAFRIAATVRGPSIIAVPRVRNGRTLPKLLCTDHWEFGAAAVEEALARVPHATSRLFGYRTALPPPKVVARRLLSPAPSQLVDPLGQIRLSPPPVSVFDTGPHATVVVSAGRTRKPVAQQGAADEDFAAVRWSALACGLACEGPLHPRRFAARFATRTQRDIVGAFLGVLGSWLYLRGASDLTGLLPRVDHDLADTDRESTVTEVLAVWGRAASRCPAGDHDDAKTSSARDLLAVGIRLLMQNPPDQFDDFTRWLRGQ